MKVNNQVPFDLTFQANDNFAKPFNIEALTNQIFFDGLYTPLVKTGSVDILDDNNKTIDKDIITDHLYNICGEHIHPDSEKFMKELFEQSLIHFDKNTHMTALEVFLKQSGNKAKMPEPSDQCIYTIKTDIIPTCKAFLGGNATYDTLFASFGFYARPKTLGVYFMNNIIFDEFKDFIKNEIQPLQSLIPSHVHQMFAEFYKLNLNDLTESLLLRNKDGESNEEFSFARLLRQFAIAFSHQKADSMYGIMPFDLGELISPKSIIFINIEKHAKSAENKINAEWKIINKSLTNKVNIVNPKKLKKLTASQRNLAKIANKIAKQSNNNRSVSKAGIIPFKKLEPNIKDITKIISKVLNAMAFINKSSNTYKSVKSTFAKPNRRNPDDFNKTGKIISKKYKPDIHLYIDTSGSISEKNYKASVQACIQMARKLNVNLYFNSFSNVMSSEAYLHTKDKSVSAIYKEFLKIPKVTGGTNFEQIWHYINNSKIRQQRMSVVITDFEWWPRSQYVKHPKNLYYIPCANLNYDSIKYFAELFVTNMQHIDRKIRKHLLF